MKARLLAAISGIIAAGSFATYVGTLSTPQRTQLRADIVELASQDPALVPLVRKVCPTCAVTPQCWRLPNGDLCRFGLRYGPGVGGVNPDGTPATCTPAPATDEPWPCTGDSAEWPQRVKDLRDAGAQADMIREIEQRVRRLPEPGGD